jgi:hypothetical protein
MPVTFLSKRQKKRNTLRKRYGNPWDSSPKSSRRNITSKRSSKKVSFRQPLVRSRSKSSSKSSSHAAWRSVSSKK